MKKSNNEVKDLTHMSATQAISSIFSFNGINHLLQDKKNQHCGQTVNTKALEFIHIGSVCLLLGGGYTAS